MRRWRGEARAIRTQVDRPDAHGTYKDYADGARRKAMRLELGEFIRRLCLHFLPARFVKIRHYGLLTNRERGQRLARARALLNPGQEAATPEPEKPTARPFPVCPHCGWAALMLVRVVGPGHWPEGPPVSDSS